MRQWVTTGMLGALGLVTVLFAGGCAATRSIDGHSAAAQIGANLARRFGGPTPQVSCPSGVTAKPGRRFNCTTILDGQPLEVTVTVATASGEFRPALDAVVIVVADAQATLAAGVTRQVSQPATVTCGGGHRLLVEEPGQSFACTASVGGAKRPLDVRVTDASGHVTYTLGPPSG